jgi:cyanophycinase
MIRKKIFSIAMAILLSCQVFSQFYPAGSLVIVGGGIEDNNARIYNQLITLAGGVDKAVFAIIPSASGAAVQSFESFKKTLVSYGVNPENILLIPLAMIDDKSTPETDESIWIKNSEDLMLAEKVRKCKAVWFTGGDQMRTTKILYRQDGSKTPVLVAVWDVYLSGGVIGGTSAGAAIMSEAMIGGGNSLGALTYGAVTNYEGEDFPEGKGVILTRGLGFFPFGIVDQHFNQRGRVGRLIVALLNKKDRFNLGFGVDENTAIIYYGHEKMLEVAGAANVTVINVAEAEYSKGQSLQVIENISISLLEDGDRYDLTTGAFIPVLGKNPTKGNEYNNIENPGQTGIFSGYVTEFRDLLTTNLMDNKGADKVKNLSFYDERFGYLVTLSKTEKSEGFYTDQPDDEDHYTVTNVRMDITPVEVKIIPRKNE